MKCTEHRCNLESYKNYDTCVLHYAKDKEMRDYHMHFNELDDFKIQLVKLIIKQLFQYHDETDEVNSSNIQMYLLSLHSIDTPNEDIDTFLSEKKVVFNQIAFPPRDERDPWDYLPILKKLGSIHFNYARFYLSSLELDKTACFFQDCEFFDTWYMKDYISTSDLEDLAIYQACTFNQEVTCSGAPEEKYKLSNCQFNGCKFEADLIIENTIFEKPLFNNWVGFRGNISNLKIHDSIFESRLILNNQVISSIDLCNNIFKNKVEFERNIVNKCEIYNCNFEKIVDFYLSKIEEFNLKKSIFEAYTGFENCQFGYKHPENDHNEVANFNYVTFMSFVNFRNTYFFGGLNLDSINVKEPPNFLNIDVDPTNTTKETFRLIKYSFDKIGNHTDANKFFAFEMKKYKEDLYQYQDKKAEKFIFWCNEVISNFGQNYIRPIILIILLSIIFSIFKYIKDINLIYNLSPKLNDYILPIQQLLNNLAVNIIPFNKFLIEGMEFISLIYYLINSILIWQTIVALKRYTKR